MGEIAGASGIRLEEINRVVSMDGRAKPGEKPVSDYTDNLRKSKTRSGIRFSGARNVSCGFGPSKPHWDESIPKMTSTEKNILLAIDDKDGIKLLRENKIALDLLEKGLIIWSDTKQRYVTMAEGRRVADLIK